MKYSPTKESGFSLVEALIVAALSVMIFGALLGSFHYSLQLISTSKAKLSALAVANDRMEYFRSLPYTDVGTVAGIPSGTIPQNSTISLNGINFQERVLVEYVDDEADGVDGTPTPDSNGIPSDYKRIKVEYTWTLAGKTSVISLISNIVPRSVETTVGGGTVRVNVIDADASLLSGASVQLINTTLASPINITKFTDSNGAALFSGAPAASDYEVVVTANIGGKQYSTSQTYVPSVAVPNPTVAPFAVLESDVSTLTFQIGELSDLKVNTFSSLVDISVVEGFYDMTGVASASSVESDTNNLVLTNTLGVYGSSGVAYLNTFAPTTLLSWGSVRTAVTLPVNTSHKVQFFTGVAPGPYTLIPDVDLPGNAVGFTGTIINISELDIVTYPALVVGITLDTTDTSVTPVVDEIGVYYRESKTILPSVNLDIQGSKTIGTNLGTLPIYKYTNTITTDGAGEETLTDMEFDFYTFTPTGAYDIAASCPLHPVSHMAGIDTEVDLRLVPNSAQTVRVEVVNSLGQVIPGVDVNLVRPGYNTSQVTDNCGQGFFTGGLSDDSDYVLTVSGAGYVTEMLNSFVVSGDVVTRVILTE